MQTTCVVFLLILGTAVGTEHHQASRQASFMGALKPSGDAAADKADALAIEKLEKAAPEQEEADAKQMKAVAEIEEKTGKAEEAESRQEEEDGAAIEAVATITPKKKGDDAVKETAEEHSDALHLKELGAKEELDAVAEEKDAETMSGDAASVEAVAEEEEKSMKKDAAVLEAAVKTEKPNLYQMLTAVGGRCGPQTKIHLPLNKDAAGSTVWSDPFAANKKHPIGRYDVTEAKICGPGTFTFSPTSCGRMDYKPDIIEVSPKERSSGCAVVALEWCSAGGLGCMEVDC